jgi:hypothetical protein
MENKIADEELFKRFANAKGWDIDELKEELFDIYKGIPTNSISVRYWPESVMHVVELLRTEYETAERLLRWAEDNYTP